MFVILGHIILQLENEFGDELLQGSIGIYCTEQVCYFVLKFKKTAFGIYE